MYVPMMEIGIMRMAVDQSCVGVGMDMRFTHRVAWAVIVLMM